MAAISIVDHELPDLTHNLYDVNFFGEEIHTLVTATPSMVDEWISETEFIHRFRLNRLVIGFDVEWRPNFSRNVDHPVATIQLCIGRRCLIFQPIHAPSIPRSLADFLSDNKYTFVGVGIESDVEKLLDDHGLGVSRFVDLRVLAAADLNMPELRNTGLKGLAMEVLGKEVAKPRRVTMSRWDQEWLNPDQVQYACVDAYIAFEIGKTLEAWR